MTRGEHSGTGCAVSRGRAMRRAGWFIAMALVGACSAPTNERDAMADGSLDARTNDVVTSDTNDGGIDAIDGSLMDAGDVANDAFFGDVVIDFGMCGMSVRTCLCGCGMDATCQGACISADDNCSACFYGAAMACCPMEEAAFGTCIDRNMCVDQACVTAHCATEEAAFNTCFQRRQSTVPMCTEQVRACLGSDYPAVRCQMP